jgi:hypothetical protein
MAYSLTKIGSLAWNIDGGAATDFGSGAMDGTLTNIGLQTYSCSGFFRNNLV